MKRPFLAPLAVVTALILSGCAQPPEPTIEAGRWRAWLESPGGELPFGLELDRLDDRWTAHVINGEERLPASWVSVDDGRLILDIAHYDAHIEADLDADGVLHGRWWKTNELGTISELPFHAAPGPTHRFSRSGDGGRTADIGGRWSVKFADDDDLAVAEFGQDDDGIVHGTFMTTTGDYRFLAGSMDGDRLRLSVFDGAHAFLFDARLREDGSLAGDFWSRDSWHDTWTAIRDPGAELPPATEQVAWVGGLPLAEIIYPDLDGNPRSLDAPEFAGRARILEVFGTWCPNCNDATEYLVELHERYAGRGLSIVGLAFEMSGDFERDAGQVRVYRDHHGIEYPLLIAGTSDKDQASAAFPLIERVKSYPTTIFLDAEGDVHTVYSGFSGPATGVAYERLQGLFEGTIEELLGDE